MANMISFLASLIIILAIFTQKINAVDYTVTNRAANTPGGARFNRDIGAQYSKQTLAAATSFIWNTFQQTAKTYIQSYSGNVKREITGVLYHENTHIWQWNGNGRAPGGLIEGIADYVRLKAGYAPSHWVKPGQGDRWDQGYDVTARFLDYCNSLKSGFVAQLNKKMRTGYSNQYFVDLMGKTVEQLWRDYKAKFPTMNELVILDQK
ncbi:hypothetical protein R3W88_003650 [Solanum pinnatisectum]|uniref:Plant basic secretory protein (BSP) family protein n=1 Tax=Solanum pinnatisectum TaxID=50273 RepID=A0AAV9MQ72_9SOLN|nr:hypothetical protein R3W88_003650 [Solanum pinnatisectum]